MNSLTLLAVKKLRGALSPVMGIQMATNSDKFSAGRTGGERFFEQWGHYPVILDLSDQSLDNQPGQLFCHGGPRSLENSRNHKVTAHSMSTTSRCRPFLLQPRAVNGRIAM